MKRLTKAELEAANTISNEEPNLQIRKSENDRSLIGLAGVISNEDTNSRQLYAESNRSPTKKKNDRALIRPEFLMNEIIWAKIRGHSHWPAKINRITPAATGLITYEVVWYNDYRRTKIHRTQAYKFLENFEKFATKYSSVIGLKTAAFEAMYEYKQRMK